MQSKTKKITNYRLANKLEDFCSSGDFTTFISDFAKQHCSLFVNEEDQPIM